MANSSDEKIFKFVPLKSFVQASFWHKLAEFKLDVDRLNDSVKDIYGFYTNSNAQDCLLEVDYSAFKEQINAKSCEFIVHGRLHNKNTIEDFKNCDKLALLNIEAHRIWESIVNGDAIGNPSLLTRFILLSFADLKKHNYYYWFAFPTLSQPILLTHEDSGTLIGDYFQSDEIKQLNQLYFNISDQNQKSFFFITKDGMDFKFSTLAHKINVIKNENLDKLFIAFSDPCTFGNVGWPLRLALSALLFHCPCLYGKSIRILSIRVKNSVNIENSLIFNVNFPLENINFNEFKWIGWETNDHGKMLPKMAAMADSMDPERLAKSSVNLNLKLMKWRLMPLLDLEKISSTKCLLIGAGTLGCSVARNLLAWGFKTINLIDNGKVSYSNPVRQSLFTYDDAVNARDKSTTAAQCLKNICPGITSAGYNLHIPMPGHTIGEAMIKKTENDLEKLKTLIQAHDVVFMLTDSRESRWLPTLLGAFYDKIVMNSALGFDSYLVMRHGSRNTKMDNENDEINLTNGLKCIPGQQLGCYFCNDITAPGNSMKDRTLDQQCTVTRPGVSNIAGSLAVELLVSILQHRNRELAPAYVAVNTKSNGSHTTNSSIPEDILGIIPHSIRGMLSSFEQILPATQKFPQCIACSEKVLNEYKINGNVFLLKVFETAKYLEDLTGISELLNEEQEIIEYSGSDEISD